MSYELIAEEDDFQEACGSTKNLCDALKEGISRRKFTIKLLKELKEKVEESYDKHKKATIGGTVATVTGSALGIAGFISGFFTFGAGFGLAAAGGALAAAGGVTIAGSQIGYHIVSSTTGKNAQMAMDNDTKAAAAIEEYGAKLDEQLESLAKKCKTTKDGVFVCVKHYIQHGSLPKNVFMIGYNTGRGTEVVLDSAKTAARAISFGKAAATGTRLTATGLKTVAGVFRVGSVALDVIFIPIDLGIMFKAAHDIHKYKTTGESNSNVAIQIGEMIVQLKKNQKLMENFLKEQFNESPL